LYWQVNPVFKEEKRILKILGKDCGRTLKNSERYRIFLLEQLSFPVRVTGLEDFPWEEPYVLGVWDFSEYEELKKTQPSFTDTFDLEGLEPPVENSDVVARIRRITDGLEFEMGLSWLVAVDDKSKVGQLLSDYGVWHTNY
jgi:hypothetical protein